MYVFILPKSQARKETVMQKTDVTHYRVAVLAGGWSDEAQISLQSGTECVKALKTAGFTTVEMFDVKDLSFIQRLAAHEFDIAFVAMHGRYGEDGCIQGLLEILHIPYTCSGVLASAMGTAKDIAKLAYENAGIPTPKDACLASDDEIDENVVQHIVDKLGLPLFVKPTDNGSSFGVFKVEEQKDLAGAIKEAQKTGTHVLIEQAIVGTEITVPVIGNHHPHALPIVEIVFNAPFYDIQAKAEPAALHHVIPARLDKDVYARAQELAERAHVALGCRGVSRTDFIVDKNGVPYALETNIIPGMTERSLIPDSAAHEGMGFPELCKRLVEYALEK